jgi:hypothetical protein
MKGHLTEGELRAILDGEATAHESEHARQCAACQQRLEHLRLQSSAVAHKLSFLRTEEAPATAPLAAWEKFSNRIMIQKESSMLRKLFAFPVIRYAAIAALLLALVLAFPGTRALAGELLNMFRVQQVAVIPVDFTGLKQLTGGASGQQLSELISSSIDMQQKPGDPVTVANATEASQQAGFTVRLPESSTPSQIYVTGASEFTLTVDRAKAQALLNEAGRSDLILPEAIDGAKISAHVPASVSTSYGTCPKPQANDEGNLTESRMRLYRDCIIFAQIPSPTVDAPAGVDVAQLAQIGLEFTGMSSEQAKAYTNTVDWTSTLVVPIPKNAATYEQVSVDGVTGTLIQRPEGDAPQYALLWVKDGIIYAISGLGTGSQQAIDMANSLP